MKFLKVKPPLSEFDKRQFYLWGYPGESFSSMMDLGRPVYRTLKDCRANTPLIEGTGIYKITIETKGYMIKNKKERK